MTAPAELAGRAFVEALVEAGVTDACITPGSRSTPLTAALARHGRIKPWLHLDERSSAFFALGLARVTGRPVAVVCTSGTAAANFHPAVAEANLSRVPLILCTTDRPPRLRDVGAEQTIPQPGMFGANVRWAADLPVPVGASGEDAVFTATARRAVRTALGPLPGPVHLNLPFDEPLISSASGTPWSGAASPGIRPEAFRPGPTSADVERAAAALRNARRPLIIAGPETGGLPADAIVRLADALDAPVLADPLSGLRTGAHDRSRVLDAYDALARDPGIDDFAPDAVIRLGGLPTSKALNQFLARATSATHILCDAWSSLRDPQALASVVVHGDPALTCDAIAATLPASATSPGWCDAWVRRDRAARAALREAALSFDEPFEGRVFVELQDLLPPGTTIVAGNSMPVRDLDAFLACNDKPLTCIANRGANGIDGVISTALGIAAGAAGPVCLVIGDLSFYHDMNGLWAARRHGIDLSIVLVNNDGGGIFHYLPQAGHQDIFEDWFATPAGLDFSHATRMYGGCHTLATSWDTFRAALAPGPGLRIVEVLTGRARNVEMHRDAWAAAAEAARRAQELMR
ncbi:MAG: 2-succinyl-5-enolpyruvyl-6-hydroxy-3-cyclohexene-1-carboxylic-acid synthase [Dehalococcoidia bacterium]